MELSRITVRKQDIVMRPCTPCGTVTAHIGKENSVKMVPNPDPNKEHAGPVPQEQNTCLQCLVDGGNSAYNFVEWSRWIDPKTGKTLTEPRGYEVK